ncbi:hypothetical protein EXN66_Car018820 [Channa argus]|uniref:Uncharacterized protein n=3 Tax=Channa argus TaxID=215402 RepID=A0A6G1QKQ4_CHAAH|nr:hypothetical protein EXN66_Car018820 [Channa argus]
MDPAHIGGDMSPLYMPRKRKSVQSQPKSPGVQRMPETACELSTAGYAPDAPDALKMKRTYGRKR